MERPGIYHPEDLPDTSTPLQSLETHWKERTTFSQVAFSRKVAQTSTQVLYLTSLTAAGGFYVQVPKQRDLDWKLASSWGEGTSWWWEKAGPNTPDG